ncbi:uncharacterized protein LOC106879959 [Octopus bimaculoides]|uniref:uncharacterized protein LOC106879959 n=1 Tax=Octopus bimaculoides TaxID=37653 RepID=UPI00071E5C87|nr:uncharacterized protein LOC106879959 [Octopus bimaculoides]|eukprot:XP_014785205.1 PREDICTED: uncharacterized protein LOC106879959 [Octopus bimaculoides]
MPSAGQIVTLASYADNIKVSQRIQNPGDVAHLQKELDALYSLVTRRHRYFKCGRTSVKTAPIPGRPHSIIDDDTIHKVEIAILWDHRITIQQLAQEVKISVRSVENIIHDHLHMRKLSVRWIPRMLTSFQKQDLVNFSQALLVMCQENEEDFCGTLIIQDETWAHRYDPETKVQSPQWKHHDNSPTPEKARVQPSADKLKLTIFWDQRRVVIMDFLKGTTINGAYHATLLQRSRDAIKAERVTY